MNIPKTWMRSGRLVVTTLATACAPLLFAADPGSVALKIIQTTEPIFPTTSTTRMLTTGEAKLVINIDADGTLADYLVVSFSDPAFAEVAIEALKEWRYEPARVRGEPVGVRTPVAFAFEAKGRVLSVSYADTLNSLVGMADAAATERFCRPRDLDQPLQVIHSVRPRHPGQTTPSARGSGLVMLDFYIDDTGRPRMPVVLSSNDDMFSIAAVQAIEQWRFTPPTRDGRPVVVRATQQFVFSERS